MTTQQAMAALNLPPAGQAKYASIWKWAVFSISQQRKAMIRESMFVNVQLYWNRDFLFSEPAVSPQRYIRDAAEIPETPELTHFLMLITILNSGVDFVVNGLKILAYKYLILIVLLLVG